MERDAILEKLKIIISTYIEEKDKLDGLSPESDLIKDLGINSMHVVDIIIDVESEFDILIEDDQIQQMTSLEKTVEIIESKIAEKG